MNEMDTRFANQFNIQWFPGHMTKTLRMMEQEIQHVDASLVLLDARIPLSSLNPEIERITARKPKLYALNKADLADPAASWHSSRDSVASLANWLSLAAQLLGKMGEDAILLSQSGIEELALGATGGSSTMPQKQNPVANRQSP